MSSPGSDLARLSLLILLDLSELPHSALTAGVEGEDGEREGRACHHQGRLGHPGHGRLSPPHGALWTGYELPQQKFLRLPCSDL